MDKNETTRNLKDLSTDEQTYHKLHREACDKGENSYIDPKTGFAVFTELNHLKRGYCCDSGCRHCPYKSI